VEIVAEAAHIPNMRTTRNKINAAKELLALEIGFEPQVRKAFRTLFWQRATVSVRPTPKGRTEIGALHPYSAFRYISDKPVTKFAGEEFLLFSKAESEGFVTITYSNLTNDTFFNFARDLYIDENSPLDDPWNMLRADILQRAVEKWLNPLMVAYAKNRLLSEAQEYVADKCSLLLEGKILTGPVPTTENGVILSITWVFFPASLILTVCSCFLTPVTLSRAQGTKTPRSLCS